MRRNEQRRPAMVEADVAKKTGSDKHKAKTDGWASEGLT